MAARKRRERGTGAARQLPSGRWQARFRGPDGVMRPAPITFDTKLDADAWLKGQTSDVNRGMWVAPEPGGGHGPVPTLTVYSDQWLLTRRLKPRTAHEYRKLLDAHILPALGNARIDRISPATVRTWYASLNDGTPTRKAHAYSLLRTIMNTAHSDDLLPKGNPCRIRGAGQSPPAQHRAKNATMADLAAVCEVLPDCYTALVLLAAWCALRIGELTELRRKDIDLDEMVVWIRRGVTYIPGGEERGRGTWHVGEPKTRAGMRPVAIPPHLEPVLRHHLAAFTGKRQDSLLWTHPNRRDRSSTGRFDEHLSQSAWNFTWRQARVAIGRPDLRFHDLRHTGATLAAASGATIKELMQRLGHTTPRAAMIYQEAAQERDKAIAAALSEFATGGAKVVPLRRAK
jgi:integrase